MNTAPSRQDTANEKTDVMNDTSIPMYRIMVYVAEARMDPDATSSFPYSLSESEREAVALVSYVEVVIRYTPAKQRMTAVTSGPVIGSSSIDLDNTMVMTEVTKKMDTAKPTSMKFTALYSRNNDTAPMTPRNTSRVSDFLDIFCRNKDGVDLTVCETREEEK